MSETKRWSAPRCTAVLVLNWRSLFVEHSRRRAAGRGGATKVASAATPTLHIRISYLYRIYVMMTHLRPVVKTHIVHF
eukprot:103425-Pleurochrysis_carterae.AAC.5